MDEFIKKLIERLEEEMAGHLNLYCDGLIKAMSVAKELAEEYKREHDDTDYANIELYAFWKNHQWIPCSERLPNKEEYLKNDGRFIVTDGNRVYQSIYDIYICHCFRTSHSLPFGSSYKTSYEIDNCVIAWQPLPALQKHGNSRQ